MVSREGQSGIDFITVKIELAIVDIILAQFVCKPKDNDLLLSADFSNSLQFIFLINTATWVTYFYIYIFYFHLFIFFTRIGQNKEPRTLLTINS